MFTVKPIVAFTLAGAAFLIQPKTIWPLTVRGASADRELNFTIDVPRGWEKYHRLREHVGYLMLIKRDLPRRVSIDVYAFRDGDADFSRTLLRLKARWLSVYDEHVLLYRAPIPGRTGAERQLWQVRIGKEKFMLLTALLISDGRVLKLGCLAPEDEYYAYEPVFENALYSFAFEDVPDAGFKPSTTTRGIEKPQLNFDSAEPPLADTPELRALLVSVKAGDVRGVENSIKAKMNLNVRDEHGYSPLSYAMEQNKEEIAKLLVVHGATNAIAGRRMLVAIAENNIPAFHGALDDYGDVNFSDSNGNTPLIVAAAFGQREVVKILIENKAQLELVDRDGYSALFYAAQENHGVIVEELIQAGANVQRMNRFGFMPIHIAAARGHADIVSQLIAAGADVNARAAFGTTAAYWAALNDRHEALELLLSHGAKDPRANRDLDKAAKANDQVMAKAALAHKDIDTDMQDVDGFTALMHAAENGSTDVGLLLLERKANLNLQSREGHTALTLAASRGHANFVKLLLSFSARTDIRDRFGRTALHWAASQNRADAVRELARIKQSLDLQDREGMTALMLAAEAGHLEITKLLVEAKAKPKLKSRKQQTALDIAREKKFEQVISLLRKVR